MESKEINKQIRSISSRGYILLLIFYAIAFLIIFLRGYLPDSITQNAKAVHVITELGLCLVVYPFLYTLYYKKLNKQNGLKLKDVFTKPMRSKRWIFKWIVIAIGVSFLFEGIFMIAASLFLKGGSGSSSAASQPYSDNSVLGWSIYGFSLIVIAPIFEELLFRGTIYRNNEPIGQLLAAVITGVSFGIWHMSLQQAFGAAFSGIFLCLIFAKTRSIYPVMIGHSIYNFLVFSLTFLKAQLHALLSVSDKEYMIRAMFHTQPVMAFLLTIVSFLFIALMAAAPVLLIIEIVRKRKNLGLSGGEFPYPAWKKALVFLTAPVTLITFAAMIFVTR